MKVAVMIAALVLSGAAGAQSMDSQIANVDTAYSAQAFAERTAAEQQAAIDAEIARKAQIRADVRQAKRDAYIDAQADMDIQQRRVWVNRTNDIVDATIRRSDNESRRPASSYVILH
jgi:uncharacterized iron-regulated membrane protein